MPIGIQIKCDLTGRTKEIKIYGSASIRDTDQF
jgi:hypothetical protein